MLGKFPITLGFFILAVVLEPVHCTLLSRYHSHDQRYLPLLAFLCYKRQKAGRGLGTRLMLSYCTHVYIYVTKI